MSFSSMQLHDRVERGLKAAGYTEATPIQAAAIPAALAGHDVIGTAQTGTGKTAAFVLPLLHALQTPSQGRTGKTRALIVTPTRELAEQIHDVIRTLGRYSGLRSATVYGGVGMQPQAKALRQGTEIIVACPGRLLDHLDRGNARLDGVECLVLDEADRMLDMGFLPPIRRILNAVPAQRQTLLFSATFEPSLEALIAHALKQPKRFTMDVEAPAATVSHALYPVAQHLKAELLLRLLDQQQAKSVLVFTRTKHRADRMAEKIGKAGYASAALHSNKSQGQRQQALQKFRNGQVGVLVATDIAARGLDISRVSHVINVDAPDCATTYIHRIGRTGRAARSGDALTLVTPDDRELIRDIEKILGTPIERRNLAGFPYDQARPEPSGPARRGGPRASQRPLAGARRPAHAGGARGRNTLWG